jgi:hypothetical protein
MTRTISRSGCEEIHRGGCLETDGLGGDHQSGLASSPPKLPIERRNLSIVDCVKLGDFARTSQLMLAVAALGSA